MNLAKKKKEYVSALFLGFVIGFWPYLFAINVKKEFVYSLSRQANEKQSHKKCDQIWDRKNEEELARKSIKKIRKNGQNVVFHKLHETSFLGFLRIQVIPLDYKGLNDRSQGDQKR